MKDKSKVGVIVVIYNTIPKKNPISHSETESVLILVDNTPGQDLQISNTDSLIYIALGNNKGIAEAQNIGIDAANKAGCTHVIFFDQDSLIPDEYIEKMLAEYKRILSHNSNLFLLGPTAKNGRTGEEYKSNIHQDHPTDYDFIPRREIISSGSCVEMSKIKKIGNLDSSLFIDFVDFEWCWRANARGYQSGITPNIFLTHFVGQKEYKFFNQYIIISSDFRYFYQTRNYLWLIRRNYVPKQWKINNGIKRIIYPLTFPFKIRGWSKIYSYILKGFWAGIKSKPHTSI
ncbi:MAG: glycosyltransferase [Muribaculum sp.]|nr:glycosyltransferase [Muribaculum sp.]